MRYIFFDKRDRSSVSNTAITLKSKNALISKRSSLSLMPDEDKNFGAFFTFEF